MVSQRVLCRKFIGRVAELEHLAARRRAAGDSHGSTVIVFGEAGIGKSRLVQEYRARFGARGSVANAVCREFGQATFEPLARILSQLDAAGAHAFDVTQTSKEEQLTAILAAFERATSRRLTTVVVEDAHWAQVELLQMLATLTEWAANRRLLLIVTCREGDVAAASPNFKALARLARHASILRLEPFSAAEISELMNGALADLDAVLPAGALNHVRRRAAGNPLFAEELLRHAVDDAKHPREPRAKPALPISLQGVIRERLDRCETGDRELLAAASVFGQRFRIDLLGDVFKLKRADTLAALARLIELQLVDRCEDPLAYEFRHGLTRDVVYGDLVPAETNALHRRIAEAIEALEGGSAHAELLAHSFWEARLFERAAPYCEAAGDAAAVQYAYEDAALWFERAASAFAERPGDAARALKKAAIAMDRLAEPRRAIPLYERAVAAFLAAGDFKSAVEHATNVSGLYFNDGREVEALAAADRALEIGERSGRPALRNHVLLRRFSLLTVKRDRAEAARTLALIDESQLDPASRDAFEFHLSKSHFYGLCADLERRRAAIAAALDAQRLRGAQGYERRYAHGFIAIDALSLGETGEARRHARLALDIAREIRSDEAYMLAFLAVIEERAGRLAAAREYVATIAPAEILLPRYVRAIARARLALAAGDDDALRESLDLGLLGEAEWGGHSGMSLQLRCGFAAVLARLGRAAEARDLAERALDELAAIAVSFSLSWEIAALARLLPESLERLRTFVAPQGVTPQGPVDVALHALLSALAARRDGRAAQSVEFAREGARRFAAIGWPAPQAECLELAGDDAAALAIYRRHGYTADARRLERVASAGPRTQGTLSPREREVAQLIALGRNNREAAQELSVTVKAVEKYLTSIYHKLGVKSRSQLTAYVGAGAALTDRRDRGAPG